MFQFFILTWVTGWQLLLTGNVADEQVLIIESWDRRIIAGCTFWSVKYNSQLDQLDRNYYHSRLHFVHLDCNYYHAVMLYVPHLRLVLQFSSKCSSLILVILEYPYLDCIFVGIPESFPDNLRSLFHHSIHFLLWYTPSYNCKHDCCSERLLVDASVPMLVPAIYPPVHAFCGKTNN